MTSLTIHEGFQHIVTLLQLNKLPEANCLFEANYSMFSRCIGSQCEQLSRALAQSQNLELDERIRKVSQLLKKNIPAKKSEKKQEKPTEQVPPPALPEHVSSLSYKPIVTEPKPKVTVRSVPVKSIFDANIWSDNDPWMVAQRTAQAAVKKPEEKRSSKD